MRKLFVCFFLLFTSTLFAQAFRIEFGYSLLSYEQAGKLYTQDPNHVPAWYFSTPVKRKLRSPGFTFSVFYPVNFGSRSYEKFSFGPQLGFALNKSTMNVSYDHNYNKLSSRMNMRVPLMLSLRLGSLQAIYRHVPGIALSSGIEMMRLQIADQTGTFYLPVIQTSFALSRLIFNVNAYPMDVESIYVIDGQEVPRLTTKFIEFQLLLGFDCYPRRYHNDAPMKGKKRSRK